MDNPLPILLFRPRVRAVPGKCEVLGCSLEYRSLYPTDRKVCIYHLRRVIGRGFWGCGCGPHACPACARHLDAGRKVLIVGERENRPGWTGDDEAHLAEVRSDVGKGGAEAARIFLERAGALRWGRSRGQLLRLGLRWDNAINLLGPSGRSGAWNARAAREVAATIREDASRCYDAVILLGSKVQEAWGPALSATTHLPHPSGRNRLWNDPDVVAACVRQVDAVYGTPVSSGSPKPNL